MGNVKITIQKHFMVHTALVAVQILLWNILTII